MCDLDPAQQSGNCVDRLQCLYLHLESTEISSISWKEVRVPVHLHRGLRLTRTYCVTSRILPEPSYDNLRHPLVLSQHLLTACVDAQAR